MLMENIEAGCGASKEAFHLALDQNDRESLTWAYRLPYHLLLSDLRILLPK